MTLRRALASLLALGGLVGIAAASAPTAALLPACTSLPNGTCFGDQVNVYNLTDAGPDPSCTTCLQSKACCDEVGRCEEDPTGACAERVRTTHACVLEGGAPQEAQCRGALVDEPSQKLYDCMRRSCGPSCGVPSCTINSAVTLIENPGCDRCMGSACCEEINTCYGNRACKLVIQCITDHCPNSFGPSLTVLGEAPADAIEAARRAVCAGGGPGQPVSPCFARCLEDFAPARDGGTVDDQQALCLSFSVYACGARYKCGPSCVAPEGGAFSGNTPWPEDEIDAGARPGDAGDGGGQ